MSNGGHPPSNIDLRCDHDDTKQSRSHAGRTAEVPFERDACVLVVLMCFRLQPSHRSLAYLPNRALRDYIYYLDSNIALLCRSGLLEV